MNSTTYFMLGLAFLLLAQSTGPVFFIIAIWYFYMAAVTK